MKTINWKKVIITTLVSACVLLNLYLLACNTLLRYSKNSASTPANTLSSQAELENAHTLFTINDLYENCGLSITDTPITNLATRATSHLCDLLDSVCTDQVVLVCRFTQYDCEKCITYALEKAMEFTESHNATLLVLAYYHDLNSLKSFKYHLGGNRNVQWYNAPALSIPIEMHGNPYYLVITKDGTVLDTFTPDKMDPVMTDRYFTLINNKWQNNSHNWYL